MSNESRGIFQHSNLDTKQKEIEWSFIQIEPVLGQKTNSLTRTQIKAIVENKNATTRRTRKVSTPGSVFLHYEAYS